VKTSGIGMILQFAKNIVVSGNPTSDYKGRLLPICDYEFITKPGHRLFCSVGKAIGNCGLQACR
jgi:hypothetical protein